MNDSNSEDSNESEEAETSDSSDRSDGDDDDIGEGHSTDEEGGGARSASAGKGSHRK